MIVKKKKKEKEKGKYAHSCEYHVHLKKKKTKEKLCFAFHIVPEKSVAFHAKNSHVSRIFVTVRRFFPRAKAIRAAAIETTAGDRADLTTISGAVSISR